MKLNDWVEKFINNEEIKEYYGKWAEELAKEQGKYEKTGNCQKNERRKFTIRVN